MITDYGSFRARLALTQNVFGTVGLKMYMTGLGLTLAGMSAAYDLFTTTFMFSEHSITLAIRGLQAESRRNLSSQILFRE